MGLRFSVRAALLVLSITACKGETKDQSRDEAKAGSNADAASRPEGLRRSHVGIREGAELFADAAGEQKVGRTSAYPTVARIVAIHGDMVEVSTDVDPGRHCLDDLLPGTRADLRVFVRGSDLVKVTHAAVEYEVSPEAQLRGEPGAPVTKGHAALLMPVPVPDASVSRSYDPKPLAAMERAGIGIKAELVPADLLVDWDRSELVFDPDEGAEDAFQIWDAVVGEDSVELWSDCNRLTLRKLPDASVRALGAETIVSPHPLDLDAFWADGSKAGKIASRSLGRGGDPTRFAGLMPSDMLLKPDAEKDGRSCYDVETSELLGAMVAEGKPEPLRVCVDSKALEALQGD